MGSGLVMAQKDSRSLYDNLMRWVFQGFANHYLLMVNTSLTMSLHFGSGSGYSEVYSFVEEGGSEGSVATLEFFPCPTCLLQLNWVYAVGWSHLVQWNLPLEAGYFSLVQGNCLFVVGYCRLSFVGRFRLVQWNLSLEAGYFNLVQGNCLFAVGCCRLFVCCWVLSLGGRFRLVLLR